MCQAKGKHRPPESIRSGRIIKEEIYRPSCDIHTIGFSLITIDSTLDNCEKLYVAK